MLSNPLGVSGHDACTSEGAVAGERRVGQCYNELECVASGGVAGGYCRAGPGSSILVGHKLHLYTGCFQIICKSKSMIVSFNS